MRLLSLRGRRSITGYGRFMLYRSPLGALVGVVAGILILAVWREVWLAAAMAAAALVILWLSRNRLPRNWR
jgi:hypothetical protein